MTKQEFKNLYDRYFDAIRRYLFYRGADEEGATDLAQDVFLRVWEKQMALEPGREASLLYKMAGDLFVSRYRRQQVERSYVNQLVYEPDHLTPESALEQAEMSARYEKALKEMNDHQRTVFLLSRMDGLKYHEIAQRLQLSVKAVEKRMNLALTYLRKVMV
ncbi:MAG: sigma-70 family RNA polymerase sigma factor [Marinilabiliaceae bacterium]|nr:sigma-70 family RNA polymerase sigma factor [Marinilabiliaceae bacterium]